jgi:hypothetical protein
MNIFIRAPWLAFAVGAIFFALSSSIWSKLLITTSTVWFLYGVYEYLMRFRVLCSGECNIRIDLLLIYPILLILSVIAVATLVKRSRQ